MTSEEEKSKLAVPFLERTITFESGRIRANKTVYLLVPSPLAKQLYDHKIDDAEIKQELDIKCRLISNTDEHMVLEFEIRRGGKR
ncbi:MAG: hypothetical protein JRM78_04215 [Nitrososphaerota archaeon]|jgi:hypothetical protein|nr:hypothetical protein [Nitrososphaerota archaeon]